MKIIENKPAFPDEFVKKLNKLGGIVASQMKFFSVGLLSHRQHGKKAKNYRPERTKRDSRPALQKQGSKDLTSWAG